MKKHNWLDFAEYASLLGLGIGSVASFVSTQLLYTSAPLSLLMLLNLANRRRFEQAMEQNTAIALKEQDQQLSKHIELLNQQVLSLPTPETLGGLKKSLLIKNREVLENLSAEIVAVQEEVNQRLDPLEKQDLGSARQQIGQLQEHYTHLNDSLAQVTDRIQHFSSSTKVEGLEVAIAQLKADTAQLRSNAQTLADQTKPTLTSLQDQINHLSRQFQKLPPPFDSSALKQEVAELIRVVADLVPKRDWSSLVAEIRALNQQQDSHARNEEILQRQVQELNQQIQGHSVQSNLTSLQDQIDQLNQQLQTSLSPFDPTALRQEVADLVQTVADLVPKRDWSALTEQLQSLQQQQEFQAQVEKALRQELSQISQQIQEGAIASLSADLQGEQISVEETPQSQHESHIQIWETLQRKLQAIDQQLRSLPGIERQAQIDTTLFQELQTVNQRLQASQAAPQYELVFDLRSRQIQDQRDATMTNSRRVLEEALETTQSRLILIWPWSTQCELDDALMHKLEVFLSRGCQLDLGWCHSADRNEDHFLNRINQRWMSNPQQRTALQTTLHKFLQLKRSHPDRFQFKVLGTSENFLVSDQRFAVLGMDEAVIATTVFPDLELKLRTPDLEVIQQFISRFDHPLLDPTDLLAHWNRAVTRYELGDREGAIADLNQVLSVDPDDAIAYNHRGLARYGLGEQWGAIADFSRSVELNPQQVVAYCNRGFVQSELGDQLAAISDYSLALQNQPDSAVAYFFRGIACQKFGDPQGSVTDYTEAIRFAPDSAVAYYHRGSAYQKLGNPQEAIADFEMAANLFTERGNEVNAQKALRSFAKMQQAADALPSNPIAIDGETQIISPAATQVVQDIQDIQPEVVEVTQSEFYDQALNNSANELKSEAATDVAAVFGTDPIFGADFGESSEAIAAYFDSFEESSAEDSTDFTQESSIEASLPFSEEEAEESDAAVFGSDSIPEADFDESSGAIAAYFDSSYFDSFSTLSEDLADFTQESVEAMLHFGERDDAEESNVAAIFGTDSIPEADFDESSEAIAAYFASFGESPAEDLADFTQESIEASPPFSEEENAEERDIAAIFGADSIPEADFDESSEAIAAYFSAFGESSAEDPTPEADFDESSEAIASYFNSFGAPSEELADFTQGGVEVRLDFSEGDNAQNLVSFFHSLDSILERNESLIESNSKAFDETTSTVSQIELAETNPEHFDFETLADFCNRF